MSQLLQRLDESIQKAVDPVYRAELQVRRACYLARIGDFAQVRSIIAEVRREYGDGTKAKVSCWLMLAEGINEIFEHVSPKAKDRIARAQLISVAIKDSTLAAITSAWKAHIDFETSDFMAMTSSLKSVFEFSDSENHEALSRAAMIIADCLYLCGDRDQAQVWFIKARSHAVEAGDQATTDALLYNRAAFGMARLRAERCMGPQDGKLIDLVRLEISSAGNFQAMIRTAALTHLIHLCEARILILSERFDDAIPILREVQNSGPFASYNFSKELIALDIIYCLHRIGCTEEALREFSLLGELNLQNYDVDERLVAIWIMYELSVTNPAFGEAPLLRQKLARCEEQYRNSCEVIQRSVEQVLAGIAQV